MSRPLDRDECPYCDGTRMADSTNVCGFCERRTQKRPPKSKKKP